MATKTIQPESLNDPRPRYSQGIQTEGGRLLFIAGQTASDKNGNVVGKGDIKAQTRQVFDNIKAVLESAGGSLDNLVMTTTYITDRKYREGYNEVRRGLVQKRSADEHPSHRQRLGQRRLHDRDRRNRSNLAL